MALPWLVYEASMQNWYIPTVTGGGCAAIENYWRFTDNNSSENRHQLISQIDGSTPALDVIQY